MLSSIDGVFGPLIMAIKMKFEEKKVLRYRIFQTEVFRDIISESIKIYEESKYIGRY